MLNHICFHENETKSTVRISLESEFIAYDEGLSDAMYDTEEEAAKKFMDLLNAGGYRATPVDVAQAKAVINHSPYIHVITWREVHDSRPYHNLSNLDLVLDWWENRQTFESEAAAITYLRERHDAGDVIHAGTWGWIQSLPHSV